tara:strand:- start:5963 stop:6187 length:225 start_codon:yes stop_codon:yes gene_type:complete
MNELIVPVLFEDMESGIINWIKKNGEKVKTGDLIFTLETDKATFEVESEGEGVLEKKIEDGEEVPVLQVVGYLK